MRGLWAIVIVAVSAMAACGSAGTATHAKKSASSMGRRRAVPDALVGDWARHFSKKEAAKSPGFPGGTYVTRFKADGTWELYAPGADPSKSCISQGQCDSSTVRADATTITLGPLPDCADPGKYSYRVRGGTLAMQKTKDDCYGGRRWAFSGTTWKRR
jgi:hypothetical protein